MLSYSTVLLRYLIDTVELSRLIESPPDVIFNGIEVALTLSAGTFAIAVTLPETAIPLLA